MSGFGEAGSRDPACLRAWAENRNRFLAPGARPTERLPDIPPAPRNTLIPQSDRTDQPAFEPAAPIAPPQLDEFMMASEAHLRGPDMARLGWREADIYGATSLKGA